MADPDKNKNWVYLPSWPWIALIWVATILMSVKVSSFDTDLVPFRMADFELTFSTGRANQILTEWDAQPNPQPDCNVRCMAQRALHWDDAFIPLYVVALILLVLRLAEQLASRFDDPKKRWAILAGYALSVCVIVAGLCDYLENWRLGALLQTPPGSLPSTGAVLVASWSALFKFALLGAAALFCLAVGSTTELARHAGALLQRLWLQVLLVLGVGIAFLAVGQAQDIIRGLADDAVAGQWFPAALFYAAIAVWSISGWYWSRFTLIFTRTPIPQDEKTDPVALWVPRLIAAAGGALIGLAFERAAGLEPVTAARWLLYIGGLVAIAISVGAVAYFAHADKVQATPRVHRIAPLPLRHASLKEADDPVKLMLWLGLAGAAVLGFGFLFFPVQFGQALGPGATLLLAVSVGLPVVGALAYVGYRYRISIALLLVALLFIDGTFDDSHKMRVLGSDENICRASAKEKMQRWLDRVANPPPADKSIPMYLVATEGGGIRAAYWTASVLAQLADTGGKDFTDHLFAISAVSGGSVGSAVYAAELASPPPAGQMTKDVQQVLGKDFLSPTLGVLASVDLVAAFLPPLPRVEARDRAFATERAFELAWERQRSPFADDFLALWPLPAGASSCPAWPNPPPPWVPSLFLNATYAEDGNRIITSDIRIDSSRFPDAHDTFADHAHVRLSTATLLSARFPYVSPAASLPLESHAVDGGYFDNSGATTLSDLLEAIRADFPAELGTNEDRTVAPRACHGTGTVCPTLIIITNGDRPDPTPIREFAQARIPPHAVLQTQTSRGYYAVDQLLREVRPNDWRCVQLRLDNSNNALPLGWMLSKSSQAEMNKQAAQVDFAKLASDSLPRCDEAKADVVACNCTPPPPPLRIPKPPVDVATGP